METDIGRWLRGKCKKKTEQLWKKSKCNKLIVNDNDNDNNSYFVLLQKILRQKRNKFTLHTSLFILLLINMKLFGKINPWKAKTRLFQCAKERKCVFPNIPSNHFFKEICQVTPLRNDKKKLYTWFWKLKKNCYSIIFAWCLFLVMPQVVRLKMEKQEAESQTESKKHMRCGKKMGKKG